MELKITRYSKEELQDILLDLAYDYLANDTKLYSQDKVLDEGLSVPSILYVDRQQFMSDIEYRIADFTKDQKETSSKEEKDIFGYAIQVLKAELDRLKNYNMATQKDTYARTGEVHTTHTFCIFPLNKKLNALYDDFNVSIAFFDDLTVNRNTIETLENIQSPEDRKEFVKKHIEITHLFLTRTDSRQVGIEVIGEAKDEFKDLTSPNCTYLPSYYSDFNQVTLADCERIENNDLKQMIQERIDMDKENLKKVAEMNIRGDVYSIHKSGKDLYIRYVCPSTQRVYYNLLDLQYLEESQYFKKGSSKSYIMAWYSINNLFMELDEEALAITTPRC